MYDLTCFFVITRAERRVLFQRELAERETEDVLDRALLKAYHSKLNKAISAPEYFRVEQKIESLKKLRFTEEYERLQDRETYEYMKYKVAAEVGGTEELEAFRLYERTRIQEFGEEKYRLVASRAADDPLLRFLNWVKHNKWLSLCYLNNCKLDI